MEFLRKIFKRKESEVEVSADLLNGFTVYYRNSFSQRISELCNIAYSGYLQKQDEQLEENLSFLIPEKVNESQPEIQDRQVEESIERPRFRRIPHERNNIITVESIIYGDQNIFNQLYEKEFPAVVRHILANSGTVEDANDVFQDAIVLMIEIFNRKNLQIKNTTIESYLFEIARRLWFEQLRKKKAKKEMDEILLLIGGQEVEIEFYPNPERYVDISTEIEKLGDRCRELLYQFYYLNRDWKAITEILGYTSEASARNQKYKCLEKIRKNLKNGT